MAFPFPTFVSQISADDSERLVWHFFIFFSRLEYALKRHPLYLLSGSGDAKPNWDAFASKNNSLFDHDSSPELSSAVAYFVKNPPKRQLRNDGKMTWSEPRHHPPNDPLLCWLLLVVRDVRNNLFHGGKFPTGPALDPSRDRELMFHASVILNACYTLDKEVTKYFDDGFNS